MFIIKYLLSQYNVDTPIDQITLDIIDRCTAANLDLPDAVDVASAVVKHNNAEQALLQALNLGGKNG